MLKGGVLPEKEQPIMPPCLSCPFLPAFFPWPARLRDKNPDLSTLQFNRIIGPKQGEDNLSKHLLSRGISSKAGNYLLSGLLAEGMTIPVQSQGRTVGREKRILGQKGEELAAEFLRKQGYRILATNYRTPLGEIDLIARHQGKLVFIEVKTRSSTRFGLGQEAVHGHKQDRLRKLAAYYLAREGWQEAAVRFDVVAILWREDGLKMELIQGAF